MRSVSYSSEHIEIVNSGIEAISAVLNGNDIIQKEGLLLCLDRFLDPYFGYDLPFKDEIKILLQNVIVSENPIEVKEDALQLLSDYEWPPFTILENNLSKIEKELLPNVEYVINMNDCTE